MRSAEVVCDNWRCEVALSIHQPLTSASGCGWFGLTLRPRGGKATAGECGEGYVVTGERAGFRFKAKRAPDLLQEALSNSCFGVDAVPSVSCGVGSQAWAEPRPSHVIGLGNPARFGRRRCLSPDNNIDNCLGIA